MHLVHIDKLLRGVERKGEIPQERELVFHTIQIAWPSILESFLISLVGLVDMAMVGSLGPSAIASVGLTTQPKMIGLATFIALNVAVSAIVARRRGENDSESAQRTLLQALLITLFLTVVISTLCVVFAEPILRFAGSAPDTHVDAVIYFRIIMGGMIFNTVSMVINAAQRGAGNTKIAMRTNIVSNIVNITFDYLLIGGHFGFPKLGVAGAAVATVLGTIAACSMSILSIARHNQFLHFALHLPVRFERSTLRSIFKIGSSTLVEQAFMRFGFLTYAIIVAKLGTSAFAAHQIGIQLLNINFSIGDGLSVASVALVGRSLGELRPDLAKIYGGICQRFAVLFSCFLAVFFLIFSKPIFYLFTEDPAVLDYRMMLTCFMGVVTFLQITQITYSGCLRGAGDTVYTAFVSLISVGIIRPLSGWILCIPLGLGLTGAWMGLTIDQATRFALTSLRFRSGKWTKVKL